MDTADLTRAPRNMIVPGAIRIKIRTLLTDGLTRQEIAAIVGLEKEVLRRTLAEMGIETEADMWQFRNPVPTFDDEADEQPACAGHPEPDIFFGPKRIAEAKAICYTCPVRVACATYAADTDQEFGIWGGRQPSERGKTTTKTA